MMKEKEYDLKEEYVELTHLEDGKIHKGAYVLFSGITPIMHQFRKFYKSKERKEFRKMLENVKKIDQQLSNGVKPNALNIELQLFQDIEKLSRYELELYHDLHLMINISQEDYKKALSSAADFLEAFNSKEIAKLVSQLREEHEHVSEMLESEKKSDKRLDEQIRNVAGKSKKILDEIGNLSETWHEMAMENPEEFVENKAA